MMQLRSAPRHEDSGTAICEMRGAHTGRMPTDTCHRAAVAGLEAV
eukprot:CAMPEP_0184400692 /NCGR_PEP_ID=MMETSP0007-20130409/75830_1 /TAXON_ID=97485 /ORGANISM="Prymnesium parvum, Strain Texoma1" /LENGTH=44 /DNA_ID= /DNA_START= /DNA_END= /DNA_ORIENTATION=